MSVQVPYHVSSSAVSEVTGSASRTRIRCHLYSPDFIRRRTSVEYEGLPVVASLTTREAPELADSVILRLDCVCAAGLSGAVAVTVLSLEASEPLSDKPDAVLEIRTLRAGPTTGVVIVELSSSNMGSLHLTISSGCTRSRKPVPLACSSV